MILFLCPLHLMSVTEKAQNSGKQDMLEREHLAKTVI